MFPQRSALESHDPAWLDELPPNELNSRLGRNFSGITNIRTFFKFVTAGDTR
jgi:hypothetical protein